LLIAGGGFEEGSLGTYAAGWGECAIDVKEANGVFDGALRERWVVHWGNHYGR
jgi:hypothetical protein